MTTQSLTLEQARQALSLQNATAAAQAATVKARKALDAYLRQIASNPKARKLKVTEDGKNLVMY
jgi:DNA-binding FadR family transcriptional regulator